MRVYVGTYAKYNDGNIFGKWLEISDYADKDEFYQACRELHKDEDDPEFMFQDWENIPSGFICECGLNDDLFKLEDELKKHDVEPEVFMDYCEWTSDTKDIDLVSKCADAYICEIGSLDDYLDYWAEEEISCHSGTGIDFFRRYFNYEAYRKNCKDDIYESDNYAFWTNR